MQTYDVLVAGDYCLDLIFTGLPELPRLGAEVIGAGFEMLPGGAYNAVAALHRLGLRVGWAGDFGNDDFSRFVLAAAASEGLDQALFVHHDRPLRKVTVALSYPDDRAFVAFYDPDPPLPAVMRALAAVRAKALYVPGLYAGALLEGAARLARGRGLRLAMDGNASEGRTLAEPAIRRALSLLDVFLPNAAEACQMAQVREVVPACRLLAETCRLVVIKDGPNGALACRQGEILRDPALPIQPLDTTGAGDCFNAGFLCAWLEGQDLPTCLRWGNIVGGLSTLGHGGTGQRVTRAEVGALLAQGTTTA